MNQSILPLALFFLSLSLCSCHSTFFHLTDLQVDDPNPYQLPPLEIIFDEASFGMVYPDRLESEVLTDFEEEPEGIQYTSYADSRLRDARVLMEREVRNNLCQRGSRKYGTAVCRVVGENRYHDAKIYLAVSVCTVFIPNLVGFPLGRQNSEVSLEIEIFDNLGNSLGVYEGIGTGRQIQGFYYGHQAGRKTHVIAAREALQQIRQKIAKEATLLSHVLIENGTL